eukprot:4079311-Amphidinium_carterae.1
MHLLPRQCLAHEELCRAASSIEGRIVRVRSDVKDPQFDWGKVAHYTALRFQHVICTKASNMDGWMAGWMDGWMDGWMACAPSVGTAQKSNLRQPSAL